MVPASSTLAARPRGSNARRLLTLTSREAAVAEQARLHIDRWFYPCSRAMRRALGEMYVADPRFATNYEQVEPGLTAYVRDAIIANASGAEAHA
jgi:TipAS antibiotic-recognition domain